MATTWVRRNAIRYCGYGNVGEHAVTKLKRIIAEQTENNPKQRPTYVPPCTFASGGPILCFQKRRRLLRGASEYLIGSRSIRPVGA
jgi:hypothetical protein